MEWECPTCRSKMKADRFIVETPYGQKVWCTDNWHWVTPLPVPSAPPPGYEWDAKDDAIMHAMDMAFSKPLSLVMAEYDFLKLDKK